MAIGAWGAACSTYSGVARDAGGADQGTVCIVCGETGTINDSDAAIGKRAYDRLDGCNGIDGCHISGAAGLTYPLGSEAEYLVNVPSSEHPSMFRVAPGDPWNSYLYLKVLGDGGIDGARMPANQTTFDPAIPAMFYAWIEAGAPPPQ